MMKKLAAIMMTVIMVAVLIPLAMAEDAVLTFATTWSGGPNAVEATDSVYMQVWMEKTGIKVQAVSASDEQLATNPVKPDIIKVFDTGSTMGSDVYTLITYGDIIPLNDLFAAGYGENYRAWLEKIPGADKMVKNDEGVYPAFYMLREADSPKSFSGMMIRQDWLDELGLDMPKTLADWDTVLRAFKEKKGATLSGMWGGLQGLEYAFVVTDGFFHDGDTVKFGPMEENYKLFLEQFHTWYADGILDPDIFTESADAVYAKIANGEIGAVFGYTGSTFNKILTMDPDVASAWVPAPVAVFSEENPANVAFKTQPMQTTAYMISADCKNPELAARFIDWIYTEEGTMLSNFGVEGVSYEYVDGVPVFTDLINNNPDGLGRTDVLEIYAGESNKPCVITREGMMASYTQEVQQRSLEMWMDEENTIREIPTLTFTADEQDELSRIMTDVSTFVSENRINFIYGNRSLDEFEAFTAALHSMGADRALEIYQAAFDRYLVR